MSSNPSNTSLEKFEEAVLSIEAKFESKAGRNWRISSDTLAAIRSAAEVLVAEAVREQWKAFKELAKAAGVQEAITAFNTQLQPTPEEGE